MWRRGNNLGECHVADNSHSSHGHGRTKNRCFETYILQNPCFLCWHEKWNKALSKFKYRIGQIKEVVVDCRLDNGLSFVEVEDGIERTSEEERFSDKCAST